MKNKNEFPPVEYCELPENLKNEVPEIEGKRYNVVEINGVTHVFDADPPYTQISPKKVIR